MQDYLDRLIEYRMVERYGFVDIGEDTQQTLSEPPEPPSKYRLAYEAYITSKRWERRREAYYARHPRVCRACRSTQWIELHHHSYARMGHEHDDDLVPLCKDCHEAVHRLHRLSGLSLTAATRKYVVAGGGEFEVSRLRRARRRRRDSGPRPGFVTPERAAEMLGVPVELLPPPKQQKKLDGGFFREDTVRQWASNQPPRWLVQARDRCVVSPMSLAVGDAVVVVSTEPMLAWVVGRSGRVVESSGRVGRVELDDRPGSRLAVTVGMVRLVAL